MSSLLKILTLRNCLDFWTFTGIISARTTENHQTKAKIKPVAKNRANIKSREILQYSRLNKVYNSDKICLSNYVGPVIKAKFIGLENDCPLKELLVYISR